jgi:hypothetical protein
MAASRPPRLTCWRRTRGWRGNYEPRICDAARRRGGTPAPTRPGRLAFLAGGRASPLPGAQSRRHCRRPGGTEDAPSRARRTAHRGAAQPGHLPAELRPDRALVSLAAGAGQPRLQPVAAAAHRRRCRRRHAALARRLRGAGGPPPHAAHDLPGARRSALPAGAAGGGARLAGKRCVRLGRCAPGRRAGCRPRRALRPGAATRAALPLVRRRRGTRPAHPAAHPASHPLRRLVARADAPRTHCTGRAGCRPTPAGAGFHLPRLCALAAGAARRRGRRAAVGILARPVGRPAAAARPARRPAPPAYPTVRRRQLRARPVARAEPGAAAACPGGRRDALRAAVGGVFHPAPPLHRPGRPAGRRTPCGAQPSRVCAARGLLCQPAGAARRRRPRHELSPPAGRRARTGACGHRPRRVPLSPAGAAAPAGAQP